MPVAETADRADYVPAIPAACCWLCGKPGSVIYRGLRDRRGRAPGMWNFRRCAACGLLWLDPRPAAEHIGRLYADYYTHDQGARANRAAGWREYARLALLSGIEGYECLAAGRWQRRLGRLALGVPPLSEMARLGLMGLDPTAKGRLLDVGCGSGRFLALMRRAGWQVSGIEPDPRAAAVARDRFGIEVRPGGLDEARFRGRSFDAIVLSHVIEHAAGPLALLAGCRRLLRPGGCLALSTPNIESRGHNLFGAAWLHLDVPRHLQLFPASGLAAVLRRAGFEHVSITTAAKSAASTWLSSAAACGQPPSRPLAYARALAFHLAEWRMVSRGNGYGEELFAWATTGSSSE
jgi:2-polyprenyl-3-methyl-5-hydroxy-6-metoxy-1,4-benzoquinol methylase